MRPEFDADFSTAFAAEFGLAPSRLVDGLAQLVEMGLEGGSLVVGTTRGAIATMRSNRPHNRPASAHPMKPAPPVMSAVVGTVREPTQSGSPTAHTYLADRDAG